MTPGLLLVAALAVVEPLPTWDAPLRQTLGPRIPVVGLEGPEADACSGIGRVTGLDPTGEYALKVHEAPDLAARETDTLKTASLVWLCEADGAWQGIVYAAPGGDLGDCRVSTPVARPEPYSGPCRQGWVEARYIQLVAG